MKNPMPICASSVEDLFDLYHPRSSGYFVDVNGLIGFRTARIVRQRAYAGAPRSRKKRLQTIVWYWYDSDAGCYVRVGTSRSPGPWAQYYRIPKRIRR